MRLSLVQLGDMYDFWLGFMCGVHKKEDGKFFHPSLQTVRQVLAGRDAENPEKVKPENLSRYSLAVPLAYGNRCR